MLYPRRCHLAAPEASPSPEEAICLIRTTAPAVGGGAATGHGPALLTDQTVVAWGRNNHGQLGNGTNADSRVPVTTLAALTGADKIAAPVGGDFSLAN